MSRTQPNARLLAAADKLERYTAVQVANAINMLRDRIAHAHEPTNNSERVHTSDMPNPTEAAGINRTTWNAELDDLTIAIHDACHTLDLLAKRATDIQHWCNPGDKIEQAQLCKHNQTGREGVLEWGDPLCDRMPTKAGLCGAHYMRWYRHRAEHGIDTSKDFAA